MKFARIRVLGSWCFLVMAMGMFIVLPGCRTVQGVGQDLDAVGRTGEEVLMEEPFVAEDHW